MIFTTQLELNITIQDINAIYSTEYEQMLLDHAKLMYQGKCRDGQYVKSIDRLVKRSLPNVIKRDLSAKVRVYIVVEATVIRYDQYDFITGTKISKIIPAGKIGNFDMIETRNDHAVVLMKIQKGIEQFHIGDTVPVRVGQTMYKIGNGHILVNGFPCVPYVPDQVLYSFGRMTAETKEHYTKMILPLIKRELDRKEKLDQKRWNEFSELLYPYKKASKASGSIKITDIDSIENGHFGVDYKINLSEMKIYQTEPKASELSMIANETPNVALTRLSIHFVKWLETINDLAECYATDEDYHALDHVWDIYREHKL